MKNFFALLTAILLGSQMGVAGEPNSCAIQAYKNLQFYMNVKGTYMYSCQWINGDYYSNGRPKGVNCDLSVKSATGQISNWSVDLDNQCHGLRSGPNSIQPR